MLCISCGKDVPEDDIYYFKGKHMCDDYAMKAGLFPLGHTGSRSDMISEEGRCFTVPKTFDG